MKMEIDHKIQVRFADLDAYGHVNNATYLSYLEVARTEIVRDQFVQDMEKNIQYLLINVCLDYIQPITVTDDVFVRCHLCDVGKVKFKVAYNVHNGNGKTFAQGFTTHALYDGNMKRPVRLPKEWQSFCKTPEKP